MLTALSARTGLFAFGGLRSLRTRPYIAVMIRLRPIFAILLSLVLLATGGMMAVARGQTMVAGQIVLCTGTGPVTVNVDENGEPVGPVHICPDCALSLLAAVPAPEHSVAPVERAVSLHFVASVVTAESVGSVPSRARAPPVA